MYSLTVDLKSSPSIARLTTAFVVSDLTFVHFVGVWYGGCGCGGCSCTESEEAAGTISLIDIFGFESFRRNGFEQLLINYASEKLQQMFIQVQRQRLLRTQDADVHPSSVGRGQETKVYVISLMPHVRVSCLC